MSALRDGVDEYLTLRRSLGFLLRSHGTLLHDFVSFVETREAEVITIDLALRWATRQSRVSPGWWNNQLGVVRGFTRYWSARDPRTEVPPLGMLPKRAQRPSPYLYTDGDVQRLLQSAGCLRSRSKLWPTTMATLIGLLSVTGMRIGEALGLDDEDIDWDEGVITIRRAKFGKSRLIPLHRTTRSALESYAQQRDRIWVPARRSPFFPSPTWKRLRNCQVHRTFGVLLRFAGLPCTRDYRGPSLHDFRHRFAVNTLVRWYRAGLDIERHIFSLSTFLGHSCVANTYWYLAAAPELMGLACGRFERALGELP